MTFTARDNEQWKAVLRIYGATEDQIAHAISLDRTSVTKRANGKTDFPFDEVLQALVAIGFTPPPPVWGCKPAR